MKLEVGKKYITRDGEAVKIVKKVLDPPYYLGSNFIGYLENGKRYHLINTPSDLVIEVQKVTIYI